MAESSKQGAETSFPLPLDGHLLLTLSLCIFAIAPLFHPNYFQTHTGFLPIWSIDRLRDNLADLTWLPVLAPFNPWRSGGLLPYYLAAILPLPALSALKLVSMGGILAGCSGLYLWLRSWLGPYGAAVSALVYTYAPFAGATLYVRGAWSETFFWGLLPWALLAATYLVARPNPLFILGGVGFWAALGLSQLGLTVWAFLMMGVMLLTFHRPQARWPLIAALLGVGIAAAVTFLRLNQTLGPSEFDASEHLVYPAQLLSPFWGFGVSQPGWADGLSFSLGLAGLGLALLAIFVWRGGPDRRPWFFVGLALLPALLVTPAARWVWLIPGLDHLLTYPWQLLGFAGLGLAVLAGITFWLDDRLRHPPLFAAVIIFILLPMYPNLEPLYTLQPIPADPLAIYGQNALLLLDYEFTIENPAAKDNPDLPSAEQFLPISAETELKPRDKISLRVVWQVIEPLPQSYKIFAHLIDRDSQILDQNDAFPLAGTRLTDTWLPGEIIEDSYTFRLPGGRTYPAQVWLGFYNEQTFERLPVLGDNEGRAFLNVR